METQITIATAGDRIVFGFSSDQFSQAVYIPVESIEKVQQMGMEIFNALVTAAETVITERNAVTETADNSQ